MNTETLIMNSLEAINFLPNPKVFCMYPSLVQIAYRPRPLGTLAEYKENMGQNVHKLFSELKLVTDNLLSI